MATKIVKTKQKFYVTLREIAANEKCPPQAKLIIDLIAANGGKISKEDLIALLQRPPNPAAPLEGGLVTTQTAERILGFYRPKLAEMGVAREEETITETKVEVPDPPAKEEKPAKEPKAKKVKEPKNDGKGAKGEPQAA